MAAHDDHEATTGEGTPPGQHAPAGGAADPPGGRAHAGASEPAGASEFDGASEPHGASAPDGAAEPDGGAEGADGSAIGGTGLDSEAMSRRFASRIEQDDASPLPWRSIVKKTVVAVVSGVTLYLLFPSLVEVFSSFPKLTELDAIWFIIALALQIGHFTCTIALQRIALRTKAWFSVATSQLAGNAISLIVPGGAAFGATTQFRMLAASGNDSATAIGGLTAFSLLGIGGLLALPIFVLPAILAGSPIASGLEHAALLGIAAFVLFAGFGALVLVKDQPIEAAGRLVQAARNRIKRKSPPMTGLPHRLVYERNRIRDVLGQRWKAAMLLSSGRLFLDYGTLLACIRATGARPNPSLVLLAYSVAGLLALIPLTPGGLGIVEAGLSALLILANVPGADAVVAVLAYRIISYWLPILVGPVAYILFRVRYGAPGTSSGASRPGGGPGGAALATG